MREEKRSAATNRGRIFSVASKTYVLMFFVKRQDAFSALPIYLCEFKWWKGRSKRSEMSSDSVMSTASVMVLLLLTIIGLFFS